MKKGLKWLLAAGIAACLLGCGMMTAGAMMGGLDQLAYFPYIDYDKHIMPGRISPEKTATDIISSTDEGGTVEYPSVRELKIEVVGDSLVQLIELDREELPEDTIRIIHSDTGETSYKLNTKGDTLVISSPTRRNLLNRRSVEDLKIYIPRNYQFRAVSIECVSGVLDAEALYTQKLEVEAVSGSVGIGGGQVDTLAVECVSGTVECNARISREADVECTSGTVNITMAGSWQSYDYQWSCLSGTITADGRELEIGHLGEQKEQKYGTGNKLELECVSGAININYDNQS